MHARELIELAALVSVHGPVLARTSGRISEMSLEQYWTASKSRLDRWGRTLKSLSHEIDDAEQYKGTGPICRSGPEAGTDAQRWSSHELDLFRLSPEWPQLRGVLEEILTGEVLTRVWTAVMVAYDRRHGTDQGEPIARSVLIGHLEARHRVLSLLVRGPRVDAEQAVKLNHLRRRTERWTDLLIGYLMGLDDVAQFALDPDRAKGFAEDLSYQSRMPGGRFAWPLLLASLRAAFRQGLGPTSPNADLNAKIAVSILATFPPDVFDALGLFRSAWLVRMTNATADAEGMIDTLLALDEEAPPGDAGSLHGRRLDHLRRFGK